jgi:hypothetical protein
MSCRENRIYCICRIFWRIWGAGYRTLHVTKETGYLESSITTVIKIAIRAANKGVKIAMITAA